MNTPFCILQCEGIKASNSSGIKDSACTAHVQAEQFNSSSHGQGTRELGGGGGANLST